MKEKIISFVCAAALCFSQLSGAGAAAGAESYEYEGYSISRMEEAVAEFEKQIQTDGNEEGVTAEFENVVAELDYMMFQYVLASVQYSENMSEENYNEVVHMTSMQMECSNKFTDAINRAVNTQYRDLIQELACIEINSSDIVNEQEERESAATEEKNELLKQYNDVVYSDKSDSDKDLECAEVYLKLVKLNNTIVDREKYSSYIDYMYDVYQRDYTPEETDRIASSVSRLMNEADSLLTQKIIELEYEMLKDGDAGLVFENNMKIAQQYAYRISDELSMSAAELIEKGLYRTGSGTDSEQRAYTTMLSYTNNAVIYQYLYGYYNDMADSIHEFGHFNAMRLSAIPTLYIRGNNIDIAEVQSQGLEVLYTQFYEPIYGRYAGTMRLMEAMDLIRSVAAGFIGSEFENYVYENADNMTAKDVVEKYSEIKNRYKVYDVDFYRIPHFFASPGYYVSYAVSALAAINLWDVMYSDPELAVSMYNDFSHYPIWGTTGFSEALDTAGFENVLSTEFIENRASRFLSVISSGRIYGDTDENGVINSGDYVNLVRRIICPENEYDDSLYDLSNDGKVDVTDLMCMRKLILK